MDAARVAEPGSGEGEEGRPIDARPPNDDVSVLTDPSSSGTIKKHDDSSRETNEEASSSTIHDKASPCQQHDEAPASKVYVSVNNKSEEGLPRKAAEVVSKPAEEVFPGRIHDDASDQVLEESPPKLAEDSSASSLVNGSLPGPQVEHIEEHNCKEDVSDEKYPSRPDEEPANKTGTKSSTDRRDGVDDNAGNDEKVELHRKADEEPINPSDDKPVDLTDKKAVNPKDEEPASPVPPPGPRFRGKKRFKPVPELSSSSNRPTL